MDKQKGKVYIVEFESSLGTFCKVGKSVEPEERVKAIINNLTKIPTVKYTKAIASNLVASYSLVERNLHTCLGKYRDIELTNKVSYVDGGSECFLGNMEELIKDSKILNLAWYTLEFTTEANQRALRLKQKITNSEHPKVIVKYRNRLNDLNLTNLTPSELNLFIAIVSRLRDKETREITFTREELRELSEFADSHATRFNKVIDGIAYKVFDIPLKYITETGSQKGIHLFSAFEIAEDYSTLTLTVSLEAVDFFNVLTDNFTRFSLHQFAQLRSKYSKTMFMLLKQYRTTGVRMLTKEDFNKLLGVPESYQAYNVNQKILAPIRKELTPIFANLDITKVKKHNRIVGYNIRFDKEAPKKDDFDHSKSKDNLAKAFTKIKPSVDVEQSEDDGWGIM